MAELSAHVSRTDLHGAITVAGDLAECDSIDQTLDTMGAVRMLVRADTALLGEVSVGPGGEPEVEAREEPAGFFAPPARAGFVHNADEHPIVLSQHGPAPPAGAIKVSDFVPDGAWRRSAIYNECYRPMGLFWEMAAPVQLAVGGACCLAFQRAGSDFGERDRGLLDVVAPHFRAALRRSEQQAARAERQGAMDIALAQGGESIVRVGLDGRPLEVGGSARESLEKWFRQGELPDTIQAWRAAVRGQPDPTSLTVWQDQARLTVRIVAGEDEDVLLFSERSLAVPDAEALTAALPISLREAQVLARLAAGEQNAGIAHALGISPFTVARHVERIYRQLAVHTRAEATAAALAVGA